MGKRETILGTMFSLRYYKVSDLASHIVITQLLGVHTMLVFCAANQYHKLLTVYKTTQLSSHKS